MAPRVDGGVADSAAQPQPTEGETLQKIVLLLVSLRDSERVAQACAERLKIPPEKIPGLIAQALDQIAAAARYTTDQAVGEALTRLNDLYERALRVQDVKSALAAQKEIAKLQNLYRRPRHAAGQPKILTEK